MFIQKRKGEHFFGHSVVLRISHQHSIIETVLFVPPHCSLCISRFITRKLIFLSFNRVLYSCLIPYLATIVYL